MTIIIPEAKAKLEICWDNIGIPHIFASSIEDAFRGMGYACASERLWQLHLSNLYATGTAASVMGEKLIPQDLMFKAFNVPAYDIPDSPGDYIVDAYLQGVNAYVDSLTEVPPEFLKAGTEPRHYTRHDVASRYRFTGWFQHKSWLEKIYLGKLMAKHGVNLFKDHVLRCSDEDANNIELMKNELLDIDLNVARLLFPFETRLSGSNNWAISKELSASGFPMLATDPHQPHSIPNTFFYSHLSAPNWDAFGASFPGVPYFMMGFNQHVSWGLTTGVVDTFDVFIEKEPPISVQTHKVDVAGKSSQSYVIDETKGRPILESLTDALGITNSPERNSRTSLDWVMREQPSSAGVLALMPLAQNCKELGDALFENNICPLVNNIICVDRDNDMRRFVATTIRKRPGFNKEGVTGSVPLPGWHDQYSFPLAHADELLVEHKPSSGFMLTANDDTMGKNGTFPIHTFPAPDARARRIRQLLLEKGGHFDTNDFTEMQLDLLDLRAVELLPHVLEALNSDSTEKNNTEEITFAYQLLRNWDCIAHKDSNAACIFYPLIAKASPLVLMKKILGEDALLTTMPDVAPGLNRFAIHDLMKIESPWREHKEMLHAIIREHTIEVVQYLRSHYGEEWRWGDIHQISFGHSLAKYDIWSHMKVGKDPVGGTPHTLAMAMHTFPNKEKVEQNVYHGPAFRWVVDMADPLHFKFVIAGGNSGKPDSQYLSNQYQNWLEGKYYDMSLIRDELDFERIEQTD